MHKVRDELVVSPFSPKALFPRNIKVFDETTTDVTVPLHWARLAFPHMDFRDERPEAAGSNMRFVGQLRDDLRQPDAVRAVLDAWARGGGALLCLPVGYGKTLTALHLACLLKKRTLVVVHKQFLAEQWRERISQFVPGASVTTVQGSCCDVSGDFVICMLQTLVARKYPASAFATCGLVIVDEAHHVAAEAFNKAMRELCAPYTLGLTATPERRDRLGKVVEWFLGPIAFRACRENQSSTIVRVVRYSCPAYAESPPINRCGDVCFASVVSAIASDATRSSIVADLAVAMARRGHDVLVLSHRRAHCGVLRDLVRQRGVECATYLGGDKDIPGATVVVATFALASEGFDCPRLSALVLATPASDVEQACGRVMRGGSHAEIVDVVDAWGVCFAQHAKRRSFYKKGGFAVQADSPEESVEGVSFANAPCAFHDG